MARQDSITINDVLKMDCMEHAKIIGGQNGTFHVVSRVNIMADREILNWVTPGELLFLTTYSFDVEDIKWQKEFISECAKKNLSGIGIKMYPNVERISEEVLQLADDLNVPVIEIDHSLPYSEIMTHILKEIFNKQAALLLRMENIHNRIMDLILKEASINEIVDVVHENVNNPVLVKLEFPDRVIKNFSTVEEELGAALTVNAEKFFIQSFYKRNGEKLHISREFIGGKYIKRITKPIVVKENVYGCLFTWAVNQSFDEFDSSVIEASISAISMEVLKKLSVQEVESRYKQEFIEDLLSRDDKRRMKAIDRAVFFNLAKDAYFQVISINIHTDDNRSLRTSEMLSSQIIIRMHQLIEKRLEEQKLNAIASSGREQINILISVREEQKAKTAAKELVDQLEKTIFQKLEHFTVSIGVGRLYEGIDDANRSFLDAQDAISTGAILGNNSINYFEELGVYKLLCQKSLGPELEKFYISTIEELVEYDKRKSTELIKTLSAYFECNGNLKKMADMLYTHYNTISYRINRIEEIAGISLENPDERLSLEVALKIKQFLNK